MLYICAAKFEVTKNLKRKFTKLLESKQSRGLSVYKFRAIFASSFNEMGWSRPAPVPCASGCVDASLTGETEARDDFDRCLSLCSSWNNLIMLAQHLCIRLADSVWYWFVRTIPLRARMSSKQAFETRNFLEKRNSCREPGFGWPDWRAVPRGTKIAGLARVREHTSAVCALLICAGLPLLHDRTVPSSLEVSYYVLNEQEDSRR